MGWRWVAAVADMRQLPFREASFDAVICADNSLPHLLTEDDVLTALRGMRHVLRPGGVLVLTVRPYDAILRERPGSTAPRTSTLPDGRRAVTFQLWHWHDDGEHYDLEHFQLIPHDTDGTRGTDRPHDTDGTRGTDRPHGTDSPHRSGGTRDTDDWRLAVRRATYWAISRQQLTDLVLRAGFTDVRWDDPDGPASPDDGHGRPAAPPVGTTDRAGTGTSTAAVRRATAIRPGGASPARRWIAAGRMFGTSRTEPTRRTRRLHREHPVSSSPSSRPPSRSPARRGTETAGQRQRHQVRSPFPLILF